MARRTRSRTAGEAPGALFMTRDTVARETSARAATSLIVSFDLPTKCLFP
ncbi:hypothetical protein [Umezawaea sp. NPDC059074]